MRTVQDDRKLSAVIREQAMRLFAEHGFSRVTVREVAAAAGVSPGLVMHHFGSKDGLKEAIDSRVADEIEEMLSQLPTIMEESTQQSLGALMADWLDREPNLAGYMRRMLLDGGPTADALFRQFFDVATRSIRMLTEAGIMRGSVDVETQASFMLGADLAAILLRPQIERMTGIDPLSRAGLSKWTAVAMDIYTNGIFAAGPRPQPETGERWRSPE